MYIFTPPSPEVENFQMIIVLIILLANQRYDQSQPDYSDSFSLSKLITDSFLATFISFQMYRATTMLLLYELDLLPIE